MTREPESQAGQEVVRAYRAQLHAMTEGNTGALTALLDDDFTLTHMTGYVQPKQEWLAQILAGQFTYHGIEEKSVDVEADGDTVHLVGRTVTDATVYGTRAPWRLQLAMDYARVGGVWTALRAVGTSW